MFSEIFNVLNRHNTKKSNSNLSVNLNIKIKAFYAQICVECLDRFLGYSFTSTVKPDLNTTANRSS